MASSVPKYIRVGILLGLVYWLLFAAYILYYGVAYELLHGRDRTAAILDFAEDSRYFRCCSRASSALCATVCVSTEPGSPFRVVCLQEPIDDSAGSYVPEFTVFEPESDESRSLGCEYGGVVSISAGGRLWAELSFILAVLIGVASVVLVSLANRCVYARRHRHVRSGGATSDDV